MTPERWDRIQELFQAALEKEPSARAGFLDQVAGNDANLAAEVRRLLAADENAGAFLSGGPARRSTKDASVPLGRHIGPYRVTGEIGHGGMGAVYRAVRDDDEYEKQVALKLVRWGMDSSFVVERFKAERQILANLEHPNIARLLDGGTTEEGWPYFSMEYVQGQPFDRYCTSRSLSTRQRLELFLTVCSAVHYAHQRLVIHRDLKPSNILVTEEGTPKLLDFGIAKLLRDEAGGGATATAMPMMTPQYASPEQVKGEPVTTASDVYSLGLLLYETLVGRPAYEIKTGSPAEITRVVCHVEPKRPSAAAPRELSRQLAGDLDAIVLKAVRKEPARRYGSVQELSEDIRRHLAGHPVHARGDATYYRAGKFVRRHKIGVATAALVALSLLGGVVATTRQARIAEANRVRAEERFAEVRKLANAVLFKYHDGIATLPGSTPVREMLVKDGLEYLDTLSRDREADLSLQRELATAYKKVGDIQGGTEVGNIGDTKGALESRRKALVAWERIASHRSANLEDKASLASSYLDLGLALGFNGDQAGRLEMSRKGLEIYQALADANPSVLKLRGALARGLSAVAYASAMFGGDEIEPAIKNYRKAAAIYEDLSAADSTERRHRRNAALCYRHLSSLLMRRGDAAEAVELARKAVAIDERRVRTDPGDAFSKLDLSFSHYALGEVLVRSHDPAGALASLQEALKLRLTISQADPKNAHARSLVAMTHGELGDALSELGDPAGALEQHQKAAATLEAIAAADTENAIGRSEMAVWRFKVGADYATLATSEKSPIGQRISNWRAARSWFQRSADLWAELGARGRLMKRDEKEPERVAHEIGKCDTALAKLGRPAQK